MASVEGRYASLQITSQIMRKRGVCLHSCVVVAWDSSINAETGGPLGVSCVPQLLVAAADDQITLFDHRNGKSFTNPVTVSQHGMNAGCGFKRSLHPDQSRCDRGYRSRQV